MSESSSQVEVKPLDLEAELDSLVESRSRGIVVDAVLDNPSATLLELQGLGSDVLLSELLLGYVNRNKLVKV